MGNKPRFRLVEEFPDPGPTPDYVLKHAYHQCNSPEEWIDSWECTGRDHVRSRTSRSIDVGLVSLPDWVSGSEIRVFRLHTVPEKVVEPILQGINYMLRFAKADVAVNYYGVHESVEEQVESSLDNGRLNVQTLSRKVILEPWRNSLLGGRPHADVYITDKIFLGETAQYDWGISEHINGLMTFALPRRRRLDLDFLTQVASHETGHLVGMQFHHGDDEGYTPGYQRGPCVMLKSCPQLLPCDLCADALRAVWRGVLDGVE